MYRRFLCDYIGGFLNIHIMSNNKQIIDDPNAEKVLFFWFTMKSNVPEERKR